MRFNIYGSKGNIHYTPNGIPTLTVTAYDKIKAALPDEMITSKLTWNYPEDNNLKYSVEYFKDIIEGKDISNIEHALFVTNIIEESRE